VENRATLDEIRREVEKHSERFVFGEFSEEFERSGAFLPPDKGLHAGYTFAFLIETKRESGFVRRYFDMLAKHPAHWPCMSFSNHDVTRTVTRFGGGAEGNPALAKLMLALLFSLRGTVLLYQGEELGLPEADLRRDQLKDPVGDLYYPVAKGRDGCRTPMPWDANAPQFGFTTGTPWLPLAATHKPLAVSTQDSDPHSTLNYARALLAARRKSAALRLGEIEFLDTKEPVLAFVRRSGGESVLCVFNMAEQAVEVPASLLEGASALQMGTGLVEKQGDAVRLGPLAAFFGRR
jgi:alpha-glucosidase